MDSNNSVATNVRNILYICCYLCSDIFVRCKDFAWDKRSESWRNWSNALELIFCSIRKQDVVLYLKKKKKKEIKQDVCTNRNMKVFFFFPPFWAEWLWEALETPQHWDLPMLNYLNATAGKQRNYEKRYICLKNWLGYVVS